MHTHFTHPSCIHTYPCEYAAGTHMQVMTTTMLGGSHPLPLSQTHPTTSLTCLAASIRTQLSHKHSHSLINKNPGCRDFRVTWQFAELIKDPGSFHIFAHRPQCSPDATWLQDGCCTSGHHACIPA